MKKEKGYKTLEQQIIDLWKSRGITVEVIQVKADRTGRIVWCITASFDKNKIPFIDDIKVTKKKPKRLRP